MTFDLQTALIVIGAALAVILLVWLLLRGFTAKQSIAATQPEQAADDPYAASKERPYMRPPPPTAVAPPAAGSLHFQARDVAADGMPAAPAAPAARDEAPPPEQEVALPAPPLPGEFGGIAFPPGATDHQDDLTRLKGVGPKLAAMLNEEGITQYAQLAALGDDELAAIDARLGAFKGRLARDRVAEQARLLANGDREGFEATFGKMGG